jgi:hypothetical protein
MRQQIIGIIIDIREGKNHEVKSWKYKLKMVCFVIHILTKSGHYLQMTLTFPEFQG